MITLFRSWILATSARFFVILAIGCGLFGVFLFLASDRIDAHIYADPQVPGSIAGLVTDEHGTPLAGIEVHLYIDQDYRFLLRTTTTTVDGRYQFATLGPAVYQLEFADPSGNYAFQFYADASRAIEAADVPVSGNDITGIDARLEPGGSITGIVTATRTLSIYYSNLVLYREESPGEWHEFRYTDLGAGAGEYRIAGLANGFYHLCVRAYANNEGEVAECYDDWRQYAATAETTPISVTAGMTTANIDFVLGNLVNSPTIAGIVRAQDSKPLTQTTASLWRDTEYGWQLGFTQPLDNDGRFRFGYLDSTSRYRLSFDDRSGNYAREYYDNATSLADATIITFDGDMLRDDLEIILSPAGRITGLVTVAGQIAPLNGIVMASPNDDFSWYNWNTIIDTETGQYNIGGLPAGRYRIHAGGIWDNRQVSAFYGGSDLASATWVEVAAGEIKPNINIDLGQFDAAITGVVTYNGLPQPDIKVTVFEQGFSSSPIGTPLVYTYTDNAGAYQINGLAPGSYAVRASDPAGSLASLFYHTATDPELTSVSVPTDTVVAHIDIAMALGGTIQGHVRRYNGVPVANVFLVLYAPVQGEWRELYWERVYTDAQGDYLIQGLPEGSYRLYFVDPEQRDWSEFYSSKDSLAQPAEIPVEAGAVTSGIDVVLGPDALLHLPLVNR